MVLEHGQCVVSNTLASCPGDAGLNPNRVKVSFLEIIFILCVDLCRPEITRVS